MPFEHRHHRRVEFAETDLAGIVHFTHYFRYAEEAEHAFLRSLGLSVHGSHGGQAIGFPRLAARCEFQKPLRFEDEVEVHLWVRRKGKRSIVYQFTISRAGEAVARGEVAVLCCRLEPDGRFEPAELPPPFRDRIEEAPHRPLEFRTHEGL